MASRTQRIGTSRRLRKKSPPGRKGAQRVAVDCAAHGKLDREGIGSFALDRPAYVLQGAGELPAAGAEVGIEQLRGGDGVDVGDLPAPADGD